jgi:hypothetical protein
VRQNSPQYDPDVLDQVVTIRIAADLRRRLSKAARTKGVSISEEIRRRLAGSFGKRSPETAAIAP